MSKTYYARGHYHERRKVLFKPLFFLALVVISSIGLSLSPTQSTSALSGSDFKNGRIIDDGIFFNHTTMTPDVIQNFLNAKVPTCDTDGTSIYSGSMTRAQYGASRGAPAPYTCLKNFQQSTPSMTAENGLCAGLSGGVRSAAQIIYDSAVACGINPQVLLVLLQKEQSLVTDDWPWPIQYQNATGFGCPDTAPCDPAYSGFFYQVYNAARQFKKYGRDQSMYGYRAYRNNSVLYNPNSACGSSNVYIENQATANLYIYTPYQPNAAALNNLYGAGDNCSAYGNRNFWRMFNDWFGPTVNDSLYYAVVKSPNSPALYLQTSVGKYYIPSGEIMHDYGLDTYAVKEVSQAYIDSLPTRDWLNRVLKDDWNNYFVVDNGALHYVRDASYLSLWNLNASSAVQSLGLTYKLQGNTWLGRFAQDSSTPNGQVWMIDKGKKHLVSDASMLYAWRYTPDQLTTVSTVYLNSMPTGSDVTAYASNGTISYMVDSGSKLSFVNINVQNAYYGSSTAVVYDPITLAFLPGLNASPFVVNSSTGQWFMLEGGKKHYIPDGRLAEIWGKRPSDPLTPVSSGFIASIPDAGALTYLVQSSNPSMYWLIDGNKRYIANSDVAQAWIKAGTSPPVYSNQSLSMLPTNVSNATTAVNAIGSSYNYTLDNGFKRYLTTPSAQNAWGGQVMGVSQQLVGLVPEGSFVNYLVKSATGQGYLLMNGSTSYAIDPSYYDAWGINNTTPTISDTALARYSVSASTLKAFVKINGTSYVMSQGSKAPLRKFADAYPNPSPQEITLPSDYFNTTSDASYLVKSSNPAETRMWLVNQGKKTALSFEQQLTYGYLSRNVNPTVLPTAAINLIPDDSRQVSLLIQKQGSGIKLLSFGNALGFPSGDTLLNYSGASNGIYQVSPSLFDSFGLQRSASRLIQDDKGNYFWIENGTKRYIPSWSILTRYLSNPITYLEGTTMYLLPSGSNMTQ